MATATTVSDMIPEDGHPLFGKSFQIGTRRRTSVSLGHRGLFHRAESRYMRAQPDSDESRLMTLGPELYP